MESPRRPRRRLPFVLTSITIVLSVITFWLAFAPKPPTIDAETASKLTTSVDTLLREASEGDVSPQDWPPAVRAFGVSSLVIRQEGAYLQMGRLFVEAWGLFVLREGADFQPDNSGDPSYRLLHGRVYWYHIKG